MFDLPFLDVGAVGQHDARQIGGGGCGKDRPAKAVTRQFGQKARVVDMGMAENDRINLARSKGKRAVVEFLFGLGALKQPAIDQDMAMDGFQTKTRSGDGAGGAVEGQTGKGQAGM